MERTEPTRGCRSAGPRPRRTLARVLATAACAVSTAVSALTIQYTFTPGTSADAIAGFQAAGAIWESLLSDPVTVQLTVGTASLGFGVVGQAASRDLLYSYGAVRTSLLGDATSANDTLAVSHLPLSSVPLLINYTSDSPFSSGSATPYLDNNGSANNTTLRLTAANARALGLTVSAGGVGSLCNPCDAFIQFSSDFGFDYDRSNGIGAGLIDFVGTAVHEIGHALGFVSGVDVLDTNAPDGSTFYASNLFTFVTVLDLFRYSTASLSVGAVDWTASTTVKTFSIDGGATALATFSTGTVHGDGRQASHWKDGLGLGLMDPTVEIGTPMQLSATDILALDVLGWNLAAVPEPASRWMWPVGLVAVAAWCARRRQRS